MNNPEFTRENYDSYVSELNCLSKQELEALLKNKTDLVLVTYGDMPLLRAETLQMLVHAQQNNPGPISLLTVMNEPYWFSPMLSALGKYCGE